MHSQYDEDYFLRGKETGKSLYHDYRWLPELTLPMAEMIAKHLSMTPLSMTPSGSVLDFGCARGYLVRAFTELGYDAEGIDASDWAIANADPAIKKCVGVATTVTGEHDWIIAKDVLEHLALYELVALLPDFAKAAKKGVFIVVPLSPASGCEYVVPEYEKDITHNIRWPLSRWVTEMYSAFDETWEISARHRIVGIKDNYAGWPRGNGFITCRTISP